MAYLISKFDSVGFFLWGYIKLKVYGNVVPDMEELRWKIKLECRRIRLEMLAKVLDNCKLRLSYHKNVNGGHMESLTS